MKTSDAYHLDEVPTVQNIDSLIALAFKTIETAAIEKSQSRIEKALKKLEFFREKHSEFHEKDGWRNAVASGTTTLGYEDWLKFQAEETERFLDAYKDWKD